MDKMTLFLLNGNLAVETLSKTVSAIQVCAETASANTFFSIW